MAGLGKSVQESVVQIQWEIEERETLRVDDNFERGKNRLCRRAYCIHTELNILFRGEREDGRKKTHTSIQQHFYQTVFGSAPVVLQAAEWVERRAEEKNSNSKSEA